MRESWFKANLGYIVEERKMEDRWRELERAKGDKKGRREEARLVRTEET